MSLFGDDEVPASRAGAASLFAEAPAKGGSALFGDDADPWMPAPKKKKDPSRILQHSDIPDRYIELLDLYSHDGHMTLKGLEELLEDSRIAKQDRASITSIIATGLSPTSPLPKGSFFVALVLVAMAQSGEEISIDTVDDLKAKKLPHPDIMSAQKSTPSKVQSESNGDGAFQRVKPDELDLSGSLQQTTLDSYITTEPQDTPHAPSKTEDPHSTDPSSLGITPELPSARSRKDDINDPWSPRGSNHSRSYIQTEDRPAHASFAANSNNDSQAILRIDEVTIRALDGKEGLPLWKHINYEVKSSRRKSQVIRRYSDFTWLLECLLKKYPFRQVPLLPPKKIAGMNLTGKAADMGFLEKRRRGLSRFVNALERHPTFKSDQLVTTFLTVPTELSVWRKQASITTVEEFEDRYLPPELESSLPQGIDEWMMRTRLSLRNSIESFTQLTTLQERMIKRQELNSVDHLRFAASITTFGEQETGNFSILGGENGPGILRGLQCMAKHSTNVQQIQLNECRALEDNFLEDLKRYRGCLSAMNELFVRHAKYSGDDVPNLEKRIANSQARLETLRAKADAKETDKEKLEEGIKADQMSIVKFKNRRIFIRECMWHELQYFELQQVHITKMANDMAAARLDFAKRYVDLASTLVGDVEGMP